MFRSKLSANGRVKIPKSIRVKLGLHAGDEFEFSRADGGITLGKPAAPGRIRKYRGKDLAGRDPDDLVREMRGE